MNFTTAFPAPYRRCLGSAAIVIAAIIAPGAGANGWEHTAIDFDVLVDALDDSDAELRRRAAESLGFRPLEGADAALLARLERGESDARVRAAIYRALGALGTATALPALERCLGSVLLPMSCQISSRRALKLRSSPVGSSLRKGRRATRLATFSSPIFPTAAFTSGRWTAS